MSANTTTSRRFSWFTLVLVGASTLVLELAKAQTGAERGIACGTTAVLLTIASAMKLWIDRVFGGRVAPAKLIPLLCLGLLAFPFAIETLQRAIWHTGLSWELVLMSGLRNIGLCLAAFSRWPFYLRLASAACLFQAATAFMLSDDKLVAAALVAYGLIGCAWLMELYSANHNRQVVSGQPPRWGLPGCVALACCFVLIALILPLTPSSLAGVLPGFVPTSGGTDQRDPFARGGVNDGDDAVRAFDDPQSTGSADSQIYLDSPELSLYDVLQDQFDTPVRKMKRQIEQAIPLAPQDVRETQHKPSENTQPTTSEFSTRLRRRTQPRHPQDAPCKALFYLTGRTPLHLRMAAFERFDGVVWEEAPEQRQPLPFSFAGPTTWLKSLQSLAAPGLTQGEPQMLKFAGLQTDRLPTPALLSRFRLEQVNRTDFLTWIQSGTVKLANTSRFPGGTQIDLEYATLDPARSAELKFARAASGGDSTEASPPSDRVIALAKQWAADLPRGWPQIEAIVAGLQQHCTLDESERTPADCQDVVGRFLFDSQRGPDHHFATTAVVLLRGLGYSARVVTGFHANPDRYDARHRYIPVLAADVHFWAEVKLSGGQWITVEATPGFAIAPPRRSWNERAWAALLLVRNWATEHLTAILIGLGLSWLVYGMRRRLADAFRWSTWRLDCEVSPVRAVLATLRLLDARARSVGRPRPAGVTPRDWHGGLLHTLTTQAHLIEFCRLLDLVVHAPARSSGMLPSTAEVRTTCSSLVRAFHLDCIRGDRRSNVVVDFVLARIRSSHSPMRSAQVDFQFSD